MGYNHIMKLEIGKEVSLKVHVNSPVTNLYEIIAITPDQELYLCKKGDPSIAFKHTREDVIEPQYRFYCKSEKQCLYLTGVATIYGNEKALHRLKEVSVSLHLHGRPTKTSLKMISDTSGKLARTRFDNDLRRAIKYVNDNSVLLDEFNARWYDNLSKYFKNTKNEYNEKVMNAIFNMAGYLLVELKGF